MSVQLTFPIAGDTKKQEAATISVFSNKSLGLFLKVYPENEDNPALSTSKERLTNHVKNLNDLKKVIKNSKHKTFCLGVAGVLLVAIGVILVAGLVLSVSNPAICVTIGLAMAFSLVSGWLFLIKASEESRRDSIDSEKLAVLQKSDVVGQEQAVMKAFIERHGEELKKRLEKLVLEKLKEISSEESAGGIQEEIQSITEAIQALQELA